jgi:hypothetical protein
MGVESDVRKHRSIRSNCIRRGSVELRSAIIVLIQILLLPSAEFSYRIDRLSDHLCLLQLLLVKQPLPPHSQLLKISHFISDGLFERLIFYKPLHVSFRIILRLRSLLRARVSFEQIHGKSRVIFLQIFELGWVEDSVEFF